MRNTYLSLPTSLKLKGAALMISPLLWITGDIFLLGHGRQFICKKLEPTIVECSQQRYFLLGNLARPARTFRLKNVVLQTYTNRIEDCDEDGFCRETYYHTCAASLITNQGQIQLARRTVESTANPPTTPPDCGDTQGFRTILDQPNVKIKSVWYGHPVFDNLLIFVLIPIKLFWFVAAVVGYGVFQFESEAGKTTHSNV